MEKIPSTGAYVSKKDKRTVKIGADTASSLVTGGVDYLPEDILDQSKVGICTAISVVQLRQKQMGKKYSPDFHYLCQKKYYDQAWYEGSSIFNSLKVAKNIGFLPIDKWTHTTLKDRDLPYSQYIEKLKAIPDIEVLRLINLCEDKIAGYGSVVISSDAIAKSIFESKAGVVCRYGCQNYWWTPSWLPRDINPLRYKQETSGHAIIMSKFNYTEWLKQTLANTWGSEWCKQGSADINFSTYLPNEVWAILNENPMFKFTITMRYGSRGNEVKELQKRLLVVPQSGWFGPLTKLAVIKYQKTHGLVGDGIVGPKTLLELNK
jgi:peptidoglycan hydrolase-like protein with peptidoglycan-binding domain